MEFDFGLPRPVFAQFFTDDFAQSGRLLPAEEELTPGWAQKRVSHFGAGRFCARQGLAILGLEPTVILMGEKKEPLWPPGIVGSISHSGKLAGALVARQHQIKGLGLDIETIGKIKPEMWELIYTPAEQVFLSGLKADDEAFFTTAFFSIKEAYYKLQYPITRLFLDYVDVEVGYDNNQFSLKVIADVAPGQPAGFGIHYARHEQEVISIALLP